MTMSEPIKPSSDSTPEDQAAAKTPPKPASDIPASPTDGRLGPAADPAEGKRE
jgi:hypothetical protein